MSEDCCCEEQDDQLTILGPTTHIFMYDDDQSFGHRSPADPTGNSGRLFCQWTNTMPGAMVGVVRVPGNHLTFAQGRYDIVWAWSGIEGTLQTYWLMPRNVGTSYLVQWVLGGAVATVTGYDSSGNSIPPKSYPVLSSADPDCYVPADQQVQL